MSEPKSMPELAQRVMANQRVTGFGLKTAAVSPCPFCGAPDWLACPIVSVEEAMHKGAVCKECKRGARAIFDRTPSGISFVFVQTCGPDQPDWLEPKMGRDPAAPGAEAE